MPSRNLELKSRIPDIAAAERAAREIGGAFQWTKSQTDTYFHTATGRLKLREQDDRPAELIAYHRPDHPDVRASDYTIVIVADPALLKSALAQSLGVRVVVAKRRTLYLWHNVRIHLDDVAGLGAFVEFEAVLTDPAQDEAASAQRLEQLIATLELRDEDRISRSYSDLLE